MALIAWRTESQKIADEIEEIFRKYKYFIPYNKIEQFVIECIEEA